MAESIAGNSGSFILRQSTSFNRPFFFGTTGQTVSVKISKNCGNFAATSGGSGTATEIANGWYYIPLNSADTNAAGCLAYNCTAASGGPIDFCDIVETQVFTDLQLSNGRVLIANNLQEDQSMIFLFPLINSATGARYPGQAANITAQRSLGAGGFAPCAAVCMEIGGNGASGWYSIVLAASDLNAQTIALMFTCPNAFDVLVPVTPTP